MNNPNVPCNCGRYHPANKHDFVMAAFKAQADSKNKSLLSHPLNGPCEVCGKNHGTYVCCDLCNCVTHTCRLCGDALGHDEISACYIIAEDEEKNPEEWRMT